MGSEEAHYVYAFKYSYSEEVTTKVVFIMLSLKREKQAN